MAIRMVVTTWPRPRSLRTPKTDMGAIGLNNNDPVEDKIPESEGAPKADTCGGCGASFRAQAPLLLAVRLETEESTTARVRFFGASGFSPLRKPTAVPKRCAGMAVTA